VTLVPGRSDRQSLAVIPARGGSKRILRKNIRPMSGLPLIHWAIRTAIDSRQFNRVIVSTDDSEIAAIALEGGAEVPFTRSPGLADDYASTMSVVADAIMQVRGEDRFAYTCCIYPTGIFATIEDLHLAKLLLEANPNAHYVAPVVRYGHPIQRALEIDKKGRIAFVDDTQSQRRTQDLSPRFHDAGQFYMGRTESWLNGVSILSNAMGFEMPSWRTVDIDSEEDWIRAQAIHRTQLGL
jgi:pseudaminic acid cytidylyltransferase